jgi:hypothetical protein
MEVQDIKVVEGEMVHEIQNRYTELEADRLVFFEEGVKMAELTIPTLLPPFGVSPGYKFNTPYQGLGAHGVNNLASKLLLALLPPTTSIFRLEAGELDLEKLGAKSRGEVEEGFAKIEATVRRTIEGSGLRISIFEALKQLLVVGNVLLYLMPNGKLKVFRLDRYVVKRDTSGEVMEIITKESIDARMLPLDVQTEIAHMISEDDRSSLDLYTRSSRTNDGKWKVDQEIKGHILNVSGARSGVYKAQEHPFIPLTFTRATGEDYGRGFVEQIKGDLYSLEGLYKAILEAAAASARTIFIVRSGSVVDKKALQDADNLAVLQGNEGDVTTIGVDKARDLSVAFQTVEILSKRLSEAFLLNSSVTRNAERVSAEEIRILAQELESALGGIKSILSQELQIPLVYLLLHSLTIQNKVPKIPKEITVTITAGVESYGRGQDVQALTQYLQTMFQTFGPEIASQDLVVSEIHKRMLSGLGISPLGLIKTDEQKQAEQEQAQQAQEQQAMMEAGVRSAPTIAGKAMENPQPPDPNNKQPQ